MDLWWGHSPFLQNIASTNGHGGHSFSSPIPWRWQGAVANLEDACRFSAKSHEICAGLRAGGRVKKCRQLIYRTAILRKLYLGPSYPHYFWLVRTPGLLRMTSFPQSPSSAFYKNVWHSALSAEACSGWVVRIVSKWINHDLTREINTVTWCAHSGSVPY